MMLNSDLLLTLAHEHNRELVADGDRGRLLAKARAARKARKAPAARGRPTGTLASCEPSAAVPAR